MEADFEAEFVRLLTDHQSVIRGCVIMLLPGAPDVDDVIQKTNQVLWSKRAEFTLGTKFQAWALTVARFQVLAHRQSLKNRNWITLEEDVAEQIADDFEELPEPEFVKRRLAALRQCVDLARPEDRELLMERYWRKTRLQDFAVTRGRSLNGVRVQLFRIRAALKTCIEKRLAHECPP